MLGNGQGTNAERVTLRSRFSDLALLYPWVEGLASKYAIPSDTKFAIDLCLEEVVSNVIRHGYRGEADHPITVSFESPRESYLVFVVEDEAPRFDPVASPELPPVSAEDESGLGGQGIRLLRKFANTLAYQPTPTGNRLSMGFVAARVRVTKDSR